MARRMRHHVFGIHQAPKMVPELRAADPQALSHLSSREAHLAARDAGLPCHVADDRIELPEEPPGDGRQVVGIDRQHGVRQAVGGGDVVGRHLDVLNGSSAPLGGLHRTLVLMQQRQAGDEGEVLGVVATRTHPAASEGQLRRERIDHVQRAEEPLCVAVKLDDVLALLACEEVLQGLRSPLPVMNGARLLGALIEGEDQAPIEQLFVHVAGRRHEERHRSLHPVFVRGEPAGGRVLARAGDDQAPLRLQELEGIGSSRRSLVLGDRDDLVREVGAPHVEERLPGHGGKRKAVLLGHEVQDRIQERRFARR